MSRIDIAITEKKTNEWIINRGFCRSSALEFFCRNSSDEKIQNFEYNILMGLDLTKENFQGFLKTVQSVIDYLNNISSEKRPNYLKFYKEQTYLHFIEDSEESKRYLVSFTNDHDLDEYIIEIVQ